MLPIAALIISGLAIAGFSVLVGAWMDAERKRHQGRLERDLYNAQRNGDCGEIARICEELRTL